jgi:tetratricopeptide (TPR) repeat protein
VLGCYFQGKLAEGIAIATEGIEIGAADPSAGEKLVGYSPYHLLYGMRGALLSFSGRYSDAEQDFEIGLQGTGVTGHIVRVFAVEHGLFSGETRSALALARRAAAGVEETGATSIGKIFTQRALGMGHALSGEWGEALSAFERSIQISHDAGTFFQVEPSTLVWMARVRVALGEVDLARETLDRALAMSDQQAGQLPRSFGALVNAMITRASGATREEVEASLASALATAREHAPGYMPLVHLEHADYARELGDEAKRRGELEAARNLLAEMGATTRADQLTRELA